MKPRDEVVLIRGCISRHRFRADFEPVEFWIQAVPPSTGVAISRAILAFSLVAAGACTAPEAPRSVATPVSLALVPASESNVDLNQGTARAMPEGLFRGGLSILGCNFTNCQAGIVLTFTKNEAGGRIVKNRSERGYEAYQGLVKGNVWSGEEKMPSVGQPEVKVAANGTFGFSGLTYKYENCAYNGTDRIDCDWFNPVNAWTIKITFYKR
jgi:hypothetical protein